MININILYVRLQIVEKYPYASSISLAPIVNVEDPFHFYVLGGWTKDWFLKLYFFLVSAYTGCTFFSFFLLSRLRSTVLYVVVANNHRKNYDAKTATKYLEENIFHFNINLCMKQQKTLHELNMTCILTILKTIEKLRIPSPSHKL